MGYESTMLCLQLSSEIWELSARRNKQKDKSI